MLLLHVLSNSFKLAEKLSQQEFYCKSGHTTRIEILMLPQPESKSRYTNEVSKSHSIRSEAKAHGKLTEMSTNRDTTN